MYSKYFQKLICENKKRKDLFPDKYVFRHARDKEYHTYAFKYENFKYNFYIQKKENCFIVHLYGDYSPSNFTKLLSFKDEISNEFENNNIKLIWKPQEESNSGTRWNIFSKLEVDNLEDETKWDKYIDWQISTMIKFLQILPKYTEKLK